eukprot:COSAG04_NODE_2361_length_4270_cov_178.644929_5_plen_151_part_00
MRAPEAVPRQNNRESSILPGVVTHSIGASAVPDSVFEKNRLNHCSPSYGRSGAIPSSPDFHSGRNRKKRLRPCTTPFHASPCRWKPTPLPLQHSARWCEKRRPASQAVCKRPCSPRPKEEEGRLRLVELEPRGEGREERRHGKVLHQLWR